MSRIRADKFVNNAATGAPQLTYGAEVVAGVGLTGAGGINITGVCTAASASFTGNVSVGGVLTYEDVASIDSVGIITARSDVSIADKIIHTGDTNTAIRFPAADTFTVETAGSERLRVTSAGKVGIGSDDPSQELTVNGTDPIISVQEATVSSQVDIGTGTATGFINIQKADGTRTIQLNGSTDSYFTGGNVGIGTADPNSTLEIATGSGTRAITIEAPTLGPYIAFENSGTAFADIGSAAGLIGSGSDTEMLTLNARGSRDLAFRTNSTERLRIASNGNIGIGSQSPGSKLTVYESGGNAKLQLQRSNTASNTDDYGSVLWRSAGGTAVGSINVARQSAENDGYMFFQTASAGTLAERMRINAAGQVLIGTTSDFVRGQIQVIDGGGGEITIGRNDTTVVSGEDLGHLFFASNDETGTGVIAATINAFADANHTSASAPTNLRFGTCATNATSSSERMRINNLGRVGVLAAANSDVMQLSATTGSGESYEYLRGMHSATAVYDGTLTFRVFTNGDVENTNGDYGNISDIKLKENIVDATSQWNDLKAVRFRKFNFKAETGNQTHTQLGVIAQELELTSPGLVRETVDRDKDGNDLGTTTKSVKSSVLTMKALVALQEAMTRIETLESKVAALEG